MNEINKSHTRLERISWDFFLFNCFRLEEKLKNKKFTSIVGISRGGAIPAVILSHMLGIRHIRIDLPENLVKIPLINSIIIDDIADTGFTFKGLQEWSNFTDCIYIAPFCKDKGKEYCDLHGTCYPDDVWLKFPWEIESRF